MIKDRKLITATDRHNKLHLRKNHISYTFSRVFLSFLESFFSFFPNSLLNTLQNIVIYMQKAYISLSIDIFVNKLQFIVNITHFLFSFSYALLILSLAFFSAMVLRACTIPIDSYSYLLWICPTRISNSCIYSN